MTTQLIKVRGLTENFDDFIRAGNLLKNGEIVAIPTETVYGLAANAFSPEAVGKIFKAKGRPQDNPLIVHISDFDDLAKQKPPINVVTDKKYITNVDGRQGDL